MAKKTRRIPLLFPLSVLGLLLFLPLFLLSTQTKQENRQQAASACPVTFSNVDPNSTLGKTLACIGKQACIVRGGADGSFNATGLVNKSEAVAFIVRYQVEVLGNWEYKTPSSPSFPDVPTSHPHFKEVETARFYKFMLGTVGGAFQPSIDWVYGFHGVWRNGSTDKNGQTHSDECWGGCYNFTGSANETVTREAFVTKLFQYGLEKGNLASCPDPTNTPTPTATPVPTNTPIPTATPIPPTATPRPTPADPNCIETDLGCVPAHPLRFTEQVYMWGLGLLSGIALLFIMYGGYLIMTSQGNPTRLENGKKYIYYAVGAMILGTMGFVLLEIISKDFLQIPGFS